MSAAYHFSTVFKKETGKDVHQLSDRLPDGGEAVELLSDTE